MARATQVSPTRIVHRACPLCEATCGIAVEVDRAAGRIVTIRGDEEDPFSRGYLCPKAYGLKALQEDPDRLRRPIRRTASGWEEIGWEEALSFAAEGLRGLRDAHGAESLAAYVGNPNAHDLGAALYLPALLRSLGSKRRFSATSVDQLPKMLSSAALFGGVFTIPIPDLDRTQYLLMLGANPLASNGSLMTAPDAPGRLRRIRERGGRIVVVDPRRSETAEIADEHLFIKPGSDAFFLFALVHVLFEEGLVSLGRLEPMVRGTEALRTLAKEFPPEAVARSTGIDAATTRRIAREFAAAERAACYGRIGTCTQEFGTLASWLVDAVNVLTGNLDREGGAMFPRGAAGPGRDRPRRDGRIPYARWRSTVRNLPEFGGELPAATLAEEIDAAGEKRIRGLLTVAGNPALSTPNGARLSRALAGLDFMVSIDIYRNETTQHANVILPPNSPLERTNYDIFFEQLSVRNVSKLSPRVLEPSPDSREQWWILAELAGRLGGANADTVDELVLSHLLKATVGGEQTSCPDVTEAEARAALGPVRGPERILDLMLRAGPWGDRFDEDSDGLSLAVLRGAEHGIDLGPLEPRLPGLLGTASGAIELAPELLVSDVPRLRAALDERRREGSLVLVGRRHLRSNNSWMHNLRPLAKGRDRCTLLIHPGDAVRLGLEDGGRARVKSRVGELVAPVSVSDEMMPGVVSLPHGFGHDAPGAQLSVAADFAGVNVNLLNDETRLDVLSGNAVLNGLPVEVAPA
jgi:anaerobic selenocysteine-containing dehydrogenase